MKLPTCREAARMLFGGEHALSPEAQQALAAHLAECLACERVHKQVAWMRSADRAWQQLREPEADEPDE